MLKRTSPLRHVTVAIAAAALSLPVMSAAHAKSDAHRARHHHIRIYNTTRDPAGLSDPPRRHSPAANEINSTWPEGMRTYFGGNGP